MLDPTVKQEEIEKLVALTILKKVEYRFKVLEGERSQLDEDEVEVLRLSAEGTLTIDELKTQRELKKKRISVASTIKKLQEKEVLECIEVRYDFKNTKISSGLNGVNRVFMPSSDVFPTLVASDTNDFIALKDFTPKDYEDYRIQFLEKVYFPKHFRKITKEEACLIQGFPKDFRLPDSRARWMKLIGNSVSVPVIDVLVKAILATGVFEELEKATLKK
jgi:DNA (cytosine-5)-methyltransferase 1